VRPRGAAPVPRTRPAGRPTEHRRHDGSPWPSRVDAGWLHAADGHSVGARHRRRVDGVFHESDAVRGQPAGGGTDVHADCGRARLSSHKLARRLSRTRGIAEIGDVAVTTIARGLGVQTVSLAIPDQQDKALQIVATHGYPVELVRGLRIGAGEGVLGRVYESRTAMRLSDIGTATQGRRRPRYGSRSGMGLPMVVRSQLLGIVSVTGRHDNGEFTADDMSRLRSFAGPLALALQREQASLEAETFARAAAVDPVSSLFNRRHFEARLEEEVQRASRHNTDLALVMLDLDDFKSVNDRFGHLVGDMMLREIAEIVPRSGRRFDVWPR